MAGIGLAGCKKDPAPAAGGGASSGKSLCQELVDKSIELLKVSPDMPQEQKDAMIAELSKPEVRQEAEDKCANSPPERRDCQKAATTLAEMQACKQKFPDSGGAGVGAGGGDLCTQALDHVIQLMTADPNMPEAAKAEMIKVNAPGPERDKALADCRKEPEAKTRCALEAKSMEELGKCP